MIELLFALAFWPWALSLGLLALLLWATAEDAVYAAAAAIALYLLATWFFFDAEPWRLFTERPGLIVAVVIGYACGGALWSLFKWDRHMASSHVRELLDSARKHYSKERDRRGATDPLPPFLDSAYRPRATVPSEQKDRIVAWIVLWPCSMVLYLFGDLLRDAVNWVYNRLAGTYERITARHAR